MAHHEGRLHNKRILVTGAGSGIGRRTARHLLREGAIPILTDISDDALQESISTYSHDVDNTTLDVTCTDDWDRTIRHTTDRHGGLDGLVNCAGVALPNDDIERCTPEQFAQVMQINVTGTFLGCRAVLPIMKKNGGSIVNIGSMRSLVASADTLAYSTSKTAVLGLTRSVALYCADMQVRVNAICPGAIETEMQEAWLNALPNPAEGRRQMEAGYPVGRLGDPDEIAFAAVYLLSDESRFMTGSHLVIDGGYTAQ